MTVGSGKLFARCAMFVLMLTLLTLVAPASAQTKISESFSDTTAPGWTFTGSAFLTAPSIDAAGSGWLRLTQVMNNQQGSALYTANYFASTQPIAIKFDFVAWGGTGADGIAVFLYDSTQTMNGVAYGGGLGYCQGVGGYLAIGLDEYGNFANPGRNCSSGVGNGQNRQPESLVIRGPYTTNVNTTNPYVTGVVVPGGIDNPGAAVTTRPSAKSVIVTLTPATMGYTISAQYRANSGSAYQTLISNVSFPYTAPATLSVGISGSTGGSTNIHEVQSVLVASPDAIQVSATGPTQIAPGNTITYTVALTNNGPSAIAATDALTLVDTLPGSIGNVTWTCVGSAGAVCNASGSGNINDSNFTLPVNSTATFTISGTVAAAATCGSTLVDPASADFGASSVFTDTTPNASSASVSTTVDCSHQSLLANPTALSFGSQTLNQASPASSITLSGTDGATVTNVAITGDFTQTNNCTAPLAGPTTCTINVVFTPTAEGSRNGTLTLQSTAQKSPTIIALTGTGTSSVPNNYSFMALIGVDPSSTQTSNAITVAGTNISSPISVSGGEYSINGGAFTADAGSVSPGAQVAVRLVASAAYSTKTSAVLDIGGVTQAFDVTTRAIEPGQLSFTQSAFTSSGASATAVVTVSRSGGTDGALTAQVVDSAGTVLGTATFANGVGGAQSVTLTLTNAAAGGSYTLTLANFTGGGTAGQPQSAQLTVTAAPLKNVTLTSGGGAVNPLLLAALAVLVGLRWGKSCHVVVLGTIASMLLAGGTRAAETDSVWSNVYVGVRGGDATSLLTDRYVSSHLDALGYQVDGKIDRHYLSGTLYAGCDLSRYLSVELAWTYLGHTRVGLSGSTPANLDSLLDDAAHVTRGGGDALSLALRGRLPMTERAGLDLRAGVYGWSTRTDAWIAAVRELHQTNRGTGYTVGMGPHFLVTRRIGLGIGVDYFASTSANRFIQETASIDFHF